MTKGRPRRFAATAAGGAVAVGALLAATWPASASDEFVTGRAPAANPRSGVQDNVLAGGLDATSVAWGQLPLANPDRAAGVTHYGYTTANGGPLTQDPREAVKSEPDKNVYLVFRGRHYLYQGHEGGPRGYVTRIDLDQPDVTQRVSLVSDRDDRGGPLPTFDGITWDPFTRQLLLTAEASYPRGGVWAVTLDEAGDATTGAAVRLPALGSGGYEGIQNDRFGNVWLVEDVGGSKVSGGKVPNSYVYRFRPADRRGLGRGRLEALQVLRGPGDPVTAQQLQANPNDPFLAALHSCGSSFDTRWVTVNQGTGAGDPNGAGFDSTARAAAAGATPFKRPENGVFRPGEGFREFYFSETGDTNAASTLPGSYGGVFRLTLPDANAATGRLTPVVVGDLEHTGFDNVAFATKNQLLAVEDAGDGLHAQRNALDSGYVVDVTARGCPTPTRWLAEGRDPSATYDALFPPGYNDGDNEITGIHVSDGDPAASGLLGARTPTPFVGGWRVFWTQQHGDNVTWEVLPHAG